MKYLNFLIIILAISCTHKVNKTFKTSEIILLPKPASMELGTSYFSLKEKMTVNAEGNIPKKIADYFIKKIKNATKLSLVTSESKSAAVNFITDTSYGKDAYALTINPDKITITASEYGGFFYGVQTLLQLLTEEENEDASSSDWLLPSIKIKDKPRFKWRAYMLDEARYFHGETFVKKMLDQMAKLKMNIFHWHLTDDAGWRIEIKKYPLLTKVGAFRSDSEIGTWNSGKTSGKPHGGFYTQEQLKEIVVYAAERNITIVPEFEMPGHASAAIASYTWLGTAGKDIEVPVKFGRFYDNYDVTNPKVVQFIKDVLLEMFQIFPSKVIHIGGDEVGYDVWKKSKSVQKYMKTHGIKTPADLQIDFINKISQFMKKNGRRMMGWNEILGKNIHKGFKEKKNDKEAEIRLAKNTVVHFWKGDLALATDAAKKGYAIVNSIYTNTYLDYGYKYIT
ncbi:MAG: beta-N-acetylhexosaminidase, partial [Polaribacter sp.]